MTCQHCQTWVLDDDHRCRRCGRRVRTAPSRISPETFPIAATATAPVYEYNRAPLSAEEECPVPQTAPVSNTGQQPLFSTAIFEPRVIPFDSLTSKAERTSIRARAAQLSRPAPLKIEKVAVRHVRPRKSRSTDQRHLDFLGQEEIPISPESNIICDAPVAPAILRIEATVIDAIFVVIGCAFGAFMFRYVGGRLEFDRHVLPFLLAAALTVPFAYRLLWTFMSRDTIGMRCAGLRLVDFDGNPPSQLRRYHRFFGGILSLLAAGVGVIWSLLDEDSLTWHDHISGTFPTLASDD